MFALAKDFWKSVYKLLISYYVFNYMLYFNIFITQIILYFYIYVFRCQDVVFLGIISIIVHAVFYCNI